MQTGHMRTRLSVAGHDIAVTYKPMKTLRLRVLPPDGKVLVSASASASDDDVRRFVATNADWIARAQDRVRTRVPRTQLADGQARLWGHWHPVRLTVGASVSGELRPDGICLTAPDGDAAPRALDVLYRNELQPLAEAMLDEWAASVGRGHSVLRLRRMSSRWGSCNSRTAAITLNLRLAEFAPRLLEYVVVHEMVHLLARGHGPAFRAHLDRLLPDWQERRRQLRAEQ